MVENIHWFGHDSFRIDGSKVLYFDPWKLPQSSPKADIIFISHDHFDHCSKEDLKLISTKDAVIVTDKAAGQQLESVNFAYKEIKVLSPQEVTEIDGIKIKAVASYNTNKQFHTKESRKLGFLVTLDGTTIYFAGDTDHIPEMKDYKCDIALLPVSGIYVMTAEEAAEAALEIKPKVAIPMHYGEVAGTSLDAEKFKMLLDGKIEVRVLKPERIRILKEGRMVKMSKYKCQACSYIYDPAKGDPKSGFPPGTSFESLPGDWICPECGVGKDMFEKI
ncbi:MAG: MBL fold metallo-hydrolase [Candidatus Omnitrophota bacterium]|nr:MAG: MBL fold metallo-hydrolase [Candidatus Omnitrophota bacterium]